MPSKRLYGNIRVLPPGSETVLFRTNAERVEWYLKLGLGVLEDPDVMRLTFEPKGPGHAEDPYFLQEFKNRCVVCGTEEGLSHHHIVPECYRKYFPRTKDNFGRWMYDVLLLCVGCHGRYEVRAWELKVAICKEYGVELGGETNLDRSRLYAIKAAAALMNHASKMPEARRKELEGWLEDHFGYGPDPSEYRKIWKELAHGIEYVAPGRIIVERHVKDVDAFATRWREHFLKTMNPEFLPELWIPERKIYVG
jgi:hypothetical protein